MQELFDTTIQDNLLYAKPEATEQEMLEALKICGLNDLSQIPLSLKDQF